MEVFRRAKKATAKELKVAREEREKFTPRLCFLPEQEHTFEVGDDKKPVIYSYKYSKDDGTEAVGLGFHISSFTSEKGLFIVGYRAFLPDTYIYNGKTFETSAEDLAVGDIESAADAIAGHGAKFSLTKKLCCKQGSNYAIIRPIVEWSE